jgi:hypothetical protein
MTALVYDADGRYYSQEEAAAKGIEAVEMTETIYEVVKVVRIAVHHPVGLDADVIALAVRAEAKMLFGKQTTRIADDGDPYRDAGIGLNSRGHRR